MAEKHYLIVAEHDGEHKPYSKYTTLENAIAFAQTTRQKGFTVQLFQKIDIQDLAVAIEPVPAFHWGMDWGTRSALIRAAKERSRSRQQFR